MLSAVVCLFWGIPFPTGITAGGFDIKMNPEAGRTAAEVGSASSQQTFHGGILREGRAQGHRKAARRREGGFCLS